MSPALSLPVEAKREFEERLEAGRYQKGVRHLCERGVTKVPTKYILPISDRPQNGDDHNAANYGLRLPVINFAQLQGTGRAHVIQSLTRASEEYGFFQVGINTTFFIFFFNLDINNFIVF